MEIQKILFFVIAFLAVSIGAYPLTSLMMNYRFPILESKSQELLASIVWNLGFYSHIILGGVALLIGWIQFIKKLRKANLKIHRIIGKIYFVSALVSASSAIFISFSVPGGLIAATGFISLGLIWYYTSLKAYVFIREKRIEEHAKMMIYSYAACFAAVTFRVYQPILNLLFNDFEIAYRTVAWLCWVPNLMVAYLINNNFEGKIFKLKKYNPHE